MVGSVNTQAALGSAQPNGPRADRAGEGRSIDKFNGKPGAANAPIDLAPDPAASLAAVRDGLARALGALERASAGGAAGLAALRDDAAPAQDRVAAFARAIEAAIADGAGLLKGEALRAPLEAGSAPFEVEGVDLRVPEGEAPTEETIAALAARVDATLARFEEQAQRLSIHGGLLQRLDAAVASEVKPNLDADAARLLALQVSQGLGQRSEGFGAGAPQALLALFRA